MPQLPSPSPRFAIYALAGSVLGTALFSARVWAADAPLPNVEIDVKQTSTKPTETDTTDQQNNNNNGGGNNRGGQTVNTRSSEIYYIITLHNNSNFSASNVEVDYTIYNNTRVTSKTGSTVTVNPVTGSETVDIPANSSKDVETDKVPHEIQQASTTNGNNRRGNNNNNNQAKPITTQSIAGIWVQVKIGDSVLQTYEDPMDIKAKMDAKAKGGSSGDDLDDLDNSNL